MIERIVYLPVECCASDAEIQRITQLIVQFEASGRQSM